MFARVCALIFALVLASGQLWAQTQNPLLGTWKQNLAKSKYDGPPPRSQTLKYEAHSQGIQHASDGVNAQGETTHSDWTADYDGKDHPATGANRDSVVLKRVDSNTTEVISKKAGKAAGTATLKVSPDGKTLTRTSKDASGKMLPVAIVYDRQ